MWTIARAYNFVQLSLIDFLYFILAKLSFFLYIGDITQQEVTKKSLGGKNMKKFLCTVLSLVMVLSLAACGGGSGSGGSSSGGGASSGGASGGGDSGATGDTIKIGVFEAMTGGNAAAGELELEGFRLANTIRRHGAPRRAGCGRQQDRHR